MKKYEIYNLEYLKITLDNKFSYGLSQEWFNEAFKILAGCGATVATTLYIYELQKEKCKNLKKNEVLNIMDLMWEYLTPAYRGLNSTKLFYKGYLNFLKDQNLNFYFKYIDVKIHDKIHFEELKKFIVNALSKDIPIAFLNLCNGKEDNLDKWHWVTVISLIEDENEIFIEILDDMQVKKINLLNWFNNITNDGGFIYFYRR